MTQNVSNTANSSITAQQQTHMVLRITSKPAGSPQTLRTRFRYKSSTSCTASVTLSDWVFSHPQPLQTCFPHDVVVLRSMGRARISFSLFAIRPDLHRKLNHASSPTPECMSFRLPSFHGNGFTVEIRRHRRINDTHRRHSFRDHIDGRPAFLAWRRAQPRTCASRTCNCRLKTLGLHNGFRVKSKRLEIRKGNRASAPVLELQPPSTLLAEPIPQQTRRHQHIVHDVSKLL